MVSLCLGGVKALHVFFYSLTGGRGASVRNLIPSDPCAATPSSGLSIMYLTQIFNRTLFT